MTGPVVVAVGGDWLDAAAQAAAGLGRHLLRADGGQDVAALIGPANPASALVVGPPGLLAPRLLREVAQVRVPVGYIATACEETMRRRLDALAGRLASADGQCGPDTAPPPPARGGALRGHLVVDAIAGQDVRPVLAEGGSADALPTHFWLAESLTIHSHAEGVHADLGRTVLCGLAGPSERFTDSARGAGAAVPGGCERGVRCKRVGPEHEGMIYAEDLDVRVLFLLGCNTLAPAGSFFPSSSGLAEAVSRSRCEAILGVSGPLVVREPISDSIVLAASTGMPLGRLVTLLNSSRAIGDDHVFALIGDPELVPAATVPAATETAATQTAARPGISLRPWPDRAADQAGPADAGAWPPAPVAGLFTPDGQAVAGIPGIRGLMVAAGPADPVLITDAAERVGRDGIWLAAMAARLERAAALERALVLANRARLHADAEFGAAIRALAQARTKADATCWAGLRENELTRRIRVLRQGYSDLTTSVLDAVDAWSQAAAALHAGFVSAEAIYHAAHYFDRIVAHEEDGLCQRCGASLRLTRYQQIVGARLVREALDCPLCGPLAERPAAGWAGQLGAGPGPGRAMEVTGSEVTVRLPAAPITPGSPPLTRHAVVIVRDETLGQPVASATASALTHESLTISVSVPEMPPILQSASTVVFTALDVTMEQFRFAGGAAPSGLTGAGPAVTEPA